MFKDEVESGFSFKDPSDPLREVIFLAYDESFDIESCLDYVLTDNTSVSSVNVQMVVTDICPYDSLDVIVCYSYGDYENL